jgi:membrane associated rhomboid family serine protease
MYYIAPNALTKPNFNEKSFHSIFIDNATNTDDACDLQSVCGGILFKNAFKPDQGYRFITAIFMHSGVAQLIINLLVHIKFGMQVEKRICSLRYSIIWLISGIFGYIFGSLFVPDGNGKFIYHSKC